MTALGRREGVPKSSSSRTLAVAVLVALTLLLTPAHAQAAPDRASTTRVMSHEQAVVVDQVNRARTARDRRAIATNGLMNQKAQNWAEHLRDCQCLEHRAGPFGAPRGWCAAAENVGRSGDGGTLGAVHKAFMASSGHKRNILDRRWTALGVGVAQDQRGEYFVVHAFADLAC